MTRRLHCLLASLVLQSGLVCAAAASPERLVWPAPPARARVEFVTAFSKAEDIGIAKGFFARLKEIVLGESRPPMVRPGAVVAARKIIYVADPGARGVHRFDIAGGDYDLITAPNDLPLPSPVGLAEGANGDVYVADSGLARVFIIHAGAKSATPLPLNAVLKQPTGLAFDAATGMLYVVDAAEHCVRVFRRDGSLAATLGRRGTGDGEFNYPTHIWRTRQGRLYVTDSLNYRIQAFDAQGHFLSSFGRQGEGTGEMARPKGVATDSRGHVYVVDALFHAFQIFDETGHLLLPIGERGQGTGEFWLPTGIYIDQDGADTIYVADSYNGRVQILRPIGGPD